MKRILAVCLLLLSYTVLTASGDCKRKITSGPTPPSGMDLGLREPSKAQVVIPNVPSYIWQHGAVPTALGMIMGYYDGTDCPDLVTGDASTQTAYVNEMIAGDHGDQNCSSEFSDHFHDYACPLDTPENILTDKSQSGGAHPSNSLADFSSTSFSSLNCAYGETSVF